MDKVLLILIFSTTIFLIPTCISIYKMGFRGYFKYMRIYLNFILAKTFKSKDFGYQNAQLGNRNIGVNRFRLTFVTFYNGGFYALTTHKLWSKPNEINNKNIHQIYIDNNEVKSKFAFHVKRLDCFILNFITYIVCVYLMKKNHKFAYIESDLMSVIKEKVRLEKIKKIF